MFLLRNCFVVLRKRQWQKTVFKVFTTKNNSDRSVRRILRTLNLYTKKVFEFLFFCAHMQSSLSNNMQNILMKEHDSFHAFLTQLEHVLAVSPFLTQSDTSLDRVRLCQMLSDLSDLSDATNATTLNNINNTFNINKNPI